MVPRTERGRAPINRGASLKGFVAREAKIEKLVIIKNCSCGLAFGVTNMLPELVSPHDRPSQNVEASRHCIWRER